MVAFGVKGADVLLVDDEPLVARLYARALEAQGWSIEVAENALVALDAIERAPPRLVISDMQMPSMTGLEMLEEMVANNRKTMPLMFMSGARAGEIVDEALKEGADDFLPKGARFQLLVARVRFWLETGINGLPDDARRAARQFLPKATYIDDPLFLLDVPRPRLIERAAIALKDQIYELGEGFGHAAVDRIRFLGVASGVLTILGRNDPLSFVRRGDYLLALVDEIAPHWAGALKQTELPHLTEIVDEPTYRQARASLLLRP